MQGKVPFAVQPELVFQAIVPPRGHRSRKLALAILILAPFLFGLLALALGQDANWDFRNYHWYNAYAFLNGRYERDLLPSQIPYFYNPLLDVPFYLLASHVPAMVAGFVLGCVQGLNFVLIFMLAHGTLTIPNPRHKVIACALLAALGMLGAGSISLIGTTFYDNITSLGLLASALLTLRFYPRLMAGAGSRAFGLAVLAGLPAGLMMGLKQPFVVFCFGLCVALLFTGRPSYRRIFIAFAFGCGILLGLSVTMGPWATYLTLHYANPLFPYYNNVFRSPFEPPISLQDNGFLPHSLHDILLFPFIFAKYPERVGEIMWRDWRVPILYALLPLAVVLRLIFGRTRQTTHALATPVAARYLMWVLAISYLVWLKMFAIYRYAVPLEMLSPLVIVLAVGLLPLKLPTRGLLAGFLLLMVALSIEPGNWHRRTHWLDHVVEARIPKLGDTEGAMVLMAGYEPYAHLMTLLPPSDSFVRVTSNFSSPDKGFGMNKVLAARIDAHQGPFLVMIPPWQHQMASEALGFFALVPDWSACQTVIDHLYDEHIMDLCPVTRHLHPSKQSPS